MLPGIEHCSTDFDSAFKNVAGLNWSPWVGERYMASKTLVIGESQYEDGDFWQEGNIHSTRILIGKRFEDSKARVYMNTEKVLLNRKNPSEKERLYVWKSVAYYNLVQRLMSSRNERPSTTDLDSGWATFFELCELLQPQTCIVLGKSTCGRLGYYLNNHDTIWSRNIPEFYEKDKVINLTSKSRKMKLIFINHPSGSRGFNNNYWTELVMENDPFLSKILDINNPHSR